MSDIFDRYVFLETDEMMVVPWYATGTSLDGTRRYVWKAVRGRGYASAGTTVLPADQARAEAERLTKQNAPF